MFRTIMSIFCNESTHLSNKPECQQKGLNWSISFIPGPFIGYQHPGNLLIRVLSWSLFSERGAGEVSAGNTRICSRANKNNSRKGGRIQGGVEAGASLEAPLYPERPCLSGISFMTSSWVGSPIMAPGSVWLFATPWTVARQAPLSMGFSRQEHWSGRMWYLSQNLLMATSEAGGASRKHPGRKQKQRPVGRHPLWRAAWETVRWLKHPGSGRARQEPRKLGKGGGHRKGEIWRSLFLSGGFH